MTVPKNKTEITMVEYSVKNERCITLCPFKMKLHVDGYAKDYEIRVGTRLCSDCCHFEGANLERQIVWCSHKTKES